MKNLMNKTALTAAASALALAFALTFALSEPPSALAQSATPTATATATPTATPAPIDYDSDNDGLIDIGYPDQLNAMRHDPDGNGSVPRLDSEGKVREEYNEYTAAFPNPADRMGCPEPTDATKPPCKGYELVDDIDLAGAYSPWTPIPAWETKFTGEKHRHYSHSISNMTTTGVGLRAGLFGSIGVSGSVRNVALKDATVTLAAPTTLADGARIMAGVLAAENNGEITNVRAEGDIAYTGFETNRPFAFVGGLVGRNQLSGMINQGWADADIAVLGAGARIGGFVGDNRGTIGGSFASGDITITMPATYARTYVKAGGFVGVNNGHAGKGIIKHSMASGEVIPNNLGQAFGPVCNGGEWTYISPSPSGCSPRPTK